MKFVTTYNLIEVLNVGKDGMDIQVHSFETMEDAQEAFSKIVKLAAPDISDSEFVEITEHLHEYSKATYEKASPWYRASVVVSEPREYYLVHYGR